MKVDQGSNCHANYIIWYDIILNCIIESCILICSSLLSYPILSSSLSASIQGYHNGFAHTVSGSCDYNADISRYLLEQGAYANMLGSTNAGIIHVSYCVTYDET